MSGNSNVGNRGIYEAGDQRNVPEAEIREAQRNREQPPASNWRDRTDSKEQQRAGTDAAPSEEELTKIDPRAPATMHGNEPSRGAKVDADLRKEDEERLRQKGY